MQTFKVGDFVTIDGSTYLVHIEYNGDHYISEDVVNLFSKNNMSIKPWQPLPGEWCWFWDNEYNIDLRKFHRYSEEENIYFADNGVVYISYNFCEPFIGQLPTILQPQSKG